MLDANCCVSTSLAGAVQAPQRPPVLAQVSWEKASDSQPASAPPQRPMQPPVGSQQLPKDPWATPDPQENAVGPTAGASGIQPSTWDGSQALSGLQQPWEGQTGSQRAQRSQSQRGTSWQGPARKPYMPHLVGQEGYVSQRAQQAGPRSNPQQQDQGVHRQGQGQPPPVQPAPGLQPLQGEHAQRQGQHADRGQAGHSDRQQGQGQRPNRKSPPQPQRAYQGQPGQQFQDQDLPETLPGPPNLPQQRRNGQGPRRQVVPINPTPSQDQGQGQGQGSSLDALPPLPPRSDGTNASRPGSGRQQGQGQGPSEQAQSGALKDERSGDLPRKERKGKGRDRSSHDRCSHTQMQNVHNFLNCSLCSFHPSTNKALGTDRLHSPGRRVQQKQWHQVVFLSFKTLFASFA